MNRTDRLLAIVLELQARGRQRAEDLAATFETSKRTIYRDMLALGEAGVPFVSLPGRGYTLMEGFFLPPLSFSSAEATMLLLGTGVMAQSFDTHYREAAQTASRKISGVLPAHLQGEVQYLQDAIRFVTSSPSEGNQQKLQQLRRAIIEHRTVRFTYFARYSKNGEQVQRETNPYGLTCVNQVWYLSAYCHLRKAMRNFRLDRIDALELLSYTFERSPENWCELRRDPAQGGIAARVLIDHEMARWAREQGNFFLVAQEETADGLLVTLRIHQEREILPWLLSWGRHALVLEPATLRELLAAEIEAMQGNLRDTPNK